VEFDLLDEAMPFEGKILVSDLQGPITANDNAFELTSQLVENGERLFRALNRYEEVLAHIVRKDGIKAGDTLRLVLPFLKAYGATDSTLLRLSREGLKVVPGAGKTMRYVQEFMSSFVVSTSYEHYVGVACEEIGFPFENAFCTRLSMDMYDVDEGEMRTLRKMAQEIVRMPLIDLSPSARSVRDLSPDDRLIVRRLEDIFWTEMADLRSYQLLSQVNPVGGDEKATSVVEICKRLSVPLEDCMYVGDGVTDARALQVVRRSGGLAISFNGNAHALREADLAVISENTIVTSMLAELFYRSGRDGVLENAAAWDYDSLRSSGMVDEYLLRECARLFPSSLPTVAHINKDNLPELLRTSLEQRRRVRGGPNL
jgi:energy-converting hydrogenase A subunit R